MVVGIGSCVEGFVTLKWGHRKLNFEFYSQRCAGGRGTYFNMKYTKRAPLLSIHCTGIVRKLLAQLSKYIYEQQKGDWFEHFWDTWHFLQTPYSSHHLLLTIPSRLYHISSYNALMLWMLASSYVTSFEALFASKFHAKLLHDAFKVPIPFPRSNLMRKKIDSSRLFMPSR